MTWTSVVLTAWAVTFLALNAASSEVQGFTRRSVLSKRRASGRASRCLRAYDQDGAGRVVDAVLSGGAQEHLGERAVPATADDE